MKTAYLAESWFNPDQIRLLDAATPKLQANPTLDWQNSFRPQEHAYQNWTPEDHPDMFANPEWQMATFREDVSGINASDIVVALYDPTPKNSDPGVLWEIGYAYGLNKPVILVLPDDCQTDLNLMPALGATAVIAVKDLASFNFDQPHLHHFEGSVY